jgi:hypothetical protein
MSFVPIEDDEFFIAVGHIAYASANMWQAVEEFIFGILAMADGFSVVTTDLNYSQLNHLANALADRLIKGQKEFATVTSILNDASRWYELRNRVMHSEWQGFGGEYTCTRFRAKGKLVMMEDDFTINELFEISMSLDKCRKRLQNFCNRKRFLERTMFDEDVGVRRLARRVRARKREKTQKNPGSTEAST